MNDPKVSVIIPSYNHARFVEECLRSVYAQTYKNFEVIVLDDGSTDGSPELLKKLSGELGFHLVLKKNEGVCATLNRGIELTKGEFITFIASDDFMPPHRLMEQVEAMLKNLQADVIAGSISIINERSQIITRKKARIDGYVTLDQMLKRNVVYAPTAVFRRKTFDKFGLYDERIAVEDYYMWLKILFNNGKILNTNNNWAFYRLNNGDLDSRFRWYFKGYKQVLSDYKFDSRAIIALERYNLVYCTKMILLHGSKFFNNERDSLLKLNILYQVVLRIVALFPPKIRQHVLNSLSQKI